MAGVIEAALRGRRRDLHSVEEDLTLRDNGVSRRYRIVERIYESFSGSPTRGDVFSPDDQFVESSHSTKMRSLSPATDASAESTVPPEQIVHALFLLSRVGADMNGETSVETRADGTLSVSGTVDSAGRRDEIQRALAPLRADPHVIIHFAIADELQQASRGRHHARIAQLVEPVDGAIPLDLKVRRMLSEQGTPASELDDAVRHLSQKILQSSDTLQQHAWALDRIAECLTPEELATLSLEVRREWVEIVSLHSSALLGNIESIRSDLGALAPAGSVKHVATDRVENVRDLPRITSQILTLSRLCQRDLASGFTLSSDSARREAVNTAEFWQAFELLESLAREAEATSHVLQSSPQFSSSTSQQ